jgi:hypothetical protein
VIREDAKEPNDGRGSVTPVTFAAALRGRCSRLGLLSRDPERRPRIAASAPVARAQQVRAGELEASNRRRPV